MRTTNAGSLVDSLHLAPNGNVGIGTTSPAATLDVRTRGSEGIGAMIASFGSSNNGRINIYDELNASSLGPSLYFSAGYVGRITGAGPIAILPASSVGIGTTTPTELLTMNPAARSVLSFGAGQYAAPPIGAATSNGTKIRLYEIQGASNIDYAFGVGVTSDLWATSNGMFSWYTNVSGTPTQRMQISSAGNVGIGTTSPSYKLHVVGTAGLSSGTSWTNASDIRLKDVEGDYEYGLAEVKKLHTIRFRYKKDNPLKLPWSEKHTGFIAQEVREIIPGAVSERADGYLELNVDPIHWATVNARCFRKHVANS